jgi:hypothetical protein
MRANATPLEPSDATPLSPATRSLASSASDLRRARLVAIIALLAIALAGCGTSQPPPISSAELAGARTFPYFTLYWVGPRFQRWALTAADGLEGYKPKTGDSVYYGDCLGGEGILSSGGCLLPLKVSSAIYSLHSNVDLGPQRNAVIDGVPATIFNEGRSVELYTGRLTIDVYSNSGARALAAAKLLRPLNAAGSATGRLPLPVYCPELAGRRPAALYRLMQHLPREACELSKAALLQQRALKRGS